MSSGFIGVMAWCVPPEIATCAAPWPSLPSPQVSNCRGAGVTIAILDSGVDGSHPDLLPNLVPGYNVYGNNTDTSDVCGHGTAVAGSDAARTNNGMLMMAAAPSLDGAQIEQALFASAVDLGAAGRDPYFGYGRVNANAAVQAAIVKAGGSVDGQAPSAAITSPAASSSVSGTVTVAVNAADNVGVDRVELKANGTVVGVDSASPFSFSWNTTGVANGMNTLVAAAYDKAGNATASAPVAVNVAVHATDNSGAAGLTQKLYIDSALVATDAAGNRASRTIYVTVVR